MLHIKNFLTGQVEFHVENLPQNCLNKLRSFHISNIYYDNQSIVFNAPLGYANAIKKLISNFEYRVKENYNIFRGINYLLNHLFIVVSVFIGLIGFFIADMCVFDIKVQCTDLNVSTLVCEYLDTVGIKKFMWKSKLKEFDLATNLVENFSEVAHSNVKISGNTLVIKLVTAINEKTKKKTNYYAQFDAVIKEIITYSGTALVTAGDVVKKGDLLVSDAYPDSVVVMGEVAFVHDAEISRLVIWII